MERLIDLVDLRKLHREQRADFVADGLPEAFENDARADVPLDAPQRPFQGFDDLEDLV